MTAYQVYEQAVKPLSAEEKLVVARLIMDEVVPDIVSQAEAGYDQSNRTLPHIERISVTDEDLSAVRLPRQFGAGRHLLSGAGIDVDDLMGTPIDDMFAEYMPEEH